MSPRLAFALAAAVHAGFQLTVTTVVYPALVAVDDADWAVAHERHSRRITPVVATVYGGLVVTGAWLAVAGADDAATRLALGSTAAALVVTATVAAPLHGRLASGRSDLRRRLVRVDRVRCALAVLGAVAAQAGR